MSSKILISACLIGEKVRYNGEGFPFEHPILIEWMDNHILVPICPEVEGGFPTPRPPAEIQFPIGNTLLEGDYKITNRLGEDVTRGFLKGAEITVGRAKKEKIKLAILKDHSPSCGSSRIYNGTFSNQKVVGKGITAAYLMNNGVAVFSEKEIDLAFKFWKKLK